MRIEHSIVVGAPLHTACERWRATAVHRDADHFSGSVSFEPIAAERTRISVRVDSLRDGASERLVDALRRLQCSFEPDLEPDAL